MAKLALLSLLHLKRKKPKVVEPATKEDLMQVRADLISAVMMLTPKQKLRLLKILARRGKE